MRRRVVRRAPLASLLVLALAAGLCPAPARANVYGQANLAWDQCLVDGGPATKLFACDDDEASAHLAVVSFVLEGNLPQFAALGGKVLFVTTGGDLPDWWQVWNPGTCREGALSVDTDFSSFPHVSCRNTWQGATWGGVESFAPVSNGARLTFGFAPVVTRTLAAGTDYFAVRLVIANGRTTGPDACAGCVAPLCLYLEELRLEGADWSFPECLSSIGWNCGQAYWWGCASTGGPCVTATRNQTWGMIKTMYR